LFYCAIGRTKQGKVFKMKIRIQHFPALLALLLSATLCHATPFQATLSGLAEAPPNNSLATGSVSGDFDPVAHALTLDVAFSGLLGTTMAAHIHCCTPLPGEGTAGVATQTPTFAGFPSGVTFGNYQASFDTSLPATWNTSFLNANGGTTTGAENAFNAGLLSGRAYFNIHTSAFQGGEIRGFLQPIPEPASVAMWSAGLGLLAVAARRRRKS
jgi:hypothetical protein